MSHTPGPWHWGNYCEEVTPGNGECCELVSYGPPDDKGVSLVSTILFIDDECTVSESDARLIAAAPELLEILKDCVNGLGCQPGYVKSLTLQRAQGVIAKAEGRA